MFFLNYYVMIRLPCIKHEHKIIVGGFVNTTPDGIFVIIGAAINNGIDQKEWKTDRQTDRRTDRQTDTHTHKQIDR
jgi:hypothetical protein